MSNPRRQRNKPANKKTKQNSFVANTVERVALSDDKIKESAENFSKLGLTGQALDACAACGFVEPTPIQVQAIPAALAGNDVIGLARTGGGKTAAFLLPLIAHDRTSKPSILVLAPTRELCVQIGEQARRLALASEWVVLESFGGVNVDDQIKALQEGVDVLTATPGRLVDLYNRGYVKLEDVHTLVLDEADRMLDMGFAEDIRHLMELCKARKQTLMFSATFPPAVERLSSFYMTSPTRIDVSAKKVLSETVERTNIEVRLSERFPKLQALVQTDVENNDKVLIFANTKSSVDWVCDRLSEDGVVVDRLHSGLSQNKRLRILDGFRSGEINILVATDVAARGLDIPTVGHVINYEMPDNVEDYVHRIGRTGRHNATGRATSLITPDKRYILDLIHKVEKTGRTATPTIPRSRSYRPSRRR